MKERLYKLYKWSNSWTGTIVIVLFVIFFIAQAFRIPSGSMKDSLLIGDHLFAKKFAYGIPMPYIPFLEIPIIPWSDKLKIVDGDTPKRGDIVIFRPPQNLKTHFVKRCFALPGDEVLYTKDTLYLHPKEGDDYIKTHYKGEHIISLSGKLWVKNPLMSKHPGIHYDKNHEVFVDYIYRLFNAPSTIDMKPVSIPELPKLYAKYGRFEFNAFYKKVEPNHYYMIGDNRNHSNDSRYWGSVPYDNIEGTPWFIYFSINKDYEIRWERMFKTPSDLEDPAIIQKAIAERKEQDKNDHGLY
ncbi:MAG: signal peptidase I [Epsilonproteobacteria bacterium]|nr:signal peptidase I [Campylobacterota bacterium]